MIDSGTTYTYEEALEKSRQYFGGNELPAKVFLDKYALRNKELQLLESTPDEMFHRIATELARIEKKKFKKPMTYDEIMSYIKDFKRIIPQGSPMSGIGNPYQFVTISNCYVVESPVDSYAGIMKTDEEIVQISKRRGGVGTDISYLRPNGTPTTNAARTSTGIVPFMERYSNTIREVGQCLHGDTLVLTASGLKLISEVKKGEKVWTQKSWVNVNEVVTNSKPCIKIKTKHGKEIICSKEHVFHTIDGEKKSIDFKIGDEITQIVGEGWRGENIHLKHNGYNKDEYNNSNRLNEKISLPNILDEKLSYVLGYSYGDGSVERQLNGKNSCLSLSCSDDWQGVKTKLSKNIKDTFNYDVKIKSHDEACESLRLFSRLVLDFLGNNDILKQKSGNLVFPEKLLRAKQNVVFAFLSGYFDADGCAQKSKKVYKIASIDNDFLLVIQNILSAFGIVCNISKHIRNQNKWQDIYSLSINGQKSQKIFRQLMSQSVKISDTVIGDKIRDFTRSIYKTADFETNSSRHSYIIDNNQYISYSTCDRLKSDLNSEKNIFLLQDEVCSIEEYSGGEEQIVYDLCLDDEHLFFANGLYAHNSGRRGALMLTCSVHHPEILDFAKCKRDLTKVTGANISVRLSDEFLQAVQEGTDYEMRWPVDSKDPEMSEMVDARKVWMEIVETAHATAEPGILFWDNIIKESPADCYADFGFKTTSTNPSLRGETLVSTDSGVFPIEHLAKNGTNVKVRNLRGEWHNCHIFKSGVNKQLMKITFSNQQVVYCTPEHKWPILNTTNHIINSHTGKVLKKQTKDLQRQDKIYFPSFNNPIDNKKCGFTFDDGFVIGWNLGDGWTSYHKTQQAKQYGFVFSQEDINSKIGEKVLNYTNNLAKKNSSISRDHNSNAYSYCTTDKAVVKSFEEKGLYSKKEGVPSTVWSGNKKYIKGFIDGLFSADGHVRVCDKISNCSIVLVSSHEKIVYDIQKLLSFYGIRSNIRKSTTKNSSFPNGKKYNKEYTRFDLTISGIDVNKFSEYFSLSNESKQNKLEIIKNKNISHNDKGRIEYANKRDYIVIKNIEKTDIFEDVYDITVHDDTHTFLMESGITGNCGELPLCPYDSCRLLLLNLLTYVKNPYTSKAYFDYEEFYADAQIAQRFMDDLIDIEIEMIDRIIAKIKKDPESTGVKSRELELWKKMKKACSDGRRTGTGITALGDTLAALGYKYGSNKSIEVTEEIYKTLKLGAYRSSVDMAKELGAFKVWNHELEKDNVFLLRIKEEAPEIWADMKKYGRRNISLLTTAPAGSVSIETQTTSGVEPVYMIIMVRRKKVNPNDEGVRVDYRDQSGDCWQEFEVFHPQVEVWRKVTGKTDIKESPWWGCCAEDINWQNRVRLQAAAQRHVDHSISSTVNLPEDVSVEEVAKIYQTAWESGTKGITVYRKNCRSGVLVEKKTVQEEMIQHHDSPKRPKEMPCDVFHVSVKGHPYFALVGTLFGEPYEIFVGDANDKTISRSIKKGIIRKHKRGKYGLFSPTDPDKVIHPDIAKYIGDDYESQTRMISMSLRHGVDPSFIVHQLEKIEGDLMSFNKACSRVLKKYIKDGEAVSGEECGECGCKLIRQDGCVLCQNCGFSKC